MLRAVAPPAAVGEAMLQPARGHWSAWVLAGAAAAVLCLLGGLGLPAGRTAAPSPLLRLPIYPPQVRAGPPPVTRHPPVALHPVQPRRPVLHHLMGLLGLSLSMPQAAHPANPREALEAQYGASYASSFRPMDRRTLQSGRGAPPLSAAAPTTSSNWLAPAAPVPRLNRALALEAMGRLRDGIQDCEQAIQLDPNESASYFNKGNMEAELRDYPAALVSYTKSAYLSPGIPGYRSREALVLNELGQPEQAERILTGLVRKYPLFLEARLALVSSYWGRGEAALAEGAFLDAAQYEPRIESWGPAEALGYAQSREWPRRFPTLVAAWLAFVRNDPPPPPPPPPAP